MTTIAQSIKSLLAADSSLTALVTGGIYAAEDIGEITRQSAPAAFDANKEILPCLLIKVDGEADIPPHRTGSRMMVSIFGYQRSGHATIVAALDKVYVDLHRQKLSGQRVWEVRHANDIHDEEDQGLQCSMDVSRFEVYRLR